MSGFTKIKLLDSEICLDVRLALDGSYHALETRLAEAGIFGPIEAEQASGRARCRECGEKILAGQECVSFQLDMYINRFGRWGHAVKAWLHRTDTDCAIARSDGRENG